MEELVCDWIRARQAAKGDPRETATRPLSWIDNDDYGYCHRLEQEAIKVLDPAGLNVFERAVQDRPSSTVVGPSYADQRRVEILKAIRQKKKATSPPMRRSAPAADYEALADVCLERQRREDALARVERRLD